MMLSSISDGKRRDIANERKGCVKQCSDPAGRQPQTVAHVRDAILDITLSYLQFTGDHPDKAGRSAHRSQKSGARHAAERGAIPGGTTRNVEGVADAVTYADGVDGTTRLLLADAQTSGGLLIAVAPERADALVAALGREGTLAAAVIGRVVTGEAGRIAVR